MSLAYDLTQKGFYPEELNTAAAVTLDMATSAISLIELALTAKAIDGLSSEEFEEIAKQAEKNCPISKAVAGIKIELTVRYQ